MSCLPVLTWICLTFPGTQQPWNAVTWAMRETVKGAICFIISLGAASIKQTVNATQSCNLYRKQQETVWWVYFCLTWPPDPDPDADCMMPVSFNPKDVHSSSLNVSDIVDLPVSRVSTYKDKNKGMWIIRRFTFSGIPADILHSFYFQFSKAQATPG